MTGWATRLRYRTGASSVTRPGGNTRPPTDEGGEPVPLPESAFPAPGATAVVSDLPLVALTYTDPQGLNVVPAAIAGTASVELPLISANLNITPAATANAAAVPFPAVTTVGAGDANVTFSTPIFCRFLDLKPGIRAQTIYPVPASIDSTGATDVTAALNAFFATVPDWANIRFQASGTYRCEGTLYLANRTGLIIDGAGSTITAITAGASATPVPGHEASWPRQRAHWMLENCTNIDFLDMNVVGPNTQGGTANGYTAAYEEQAGWICHNLASGSWTNCTASYVHGDGWEATSNTRAIVIRDCNFHHVGRNGLGLVYASNITVETTAIRNITRSIVSASPTVATGPIDGITLRSNTVGAQYGKFISALGVGRVDNILVENNTVDSRVEETLSIVCAASDATRRRNWTVRGNSNGTGTYDGSPTAVMQFTDVDSVTVTGNSDGCIGYLAGVYSGEYVRTTRCCDIDVSGNSITDAGEGAVTEWFNDQQTYVCPALVYTVPTSIDQTGATDVTAALNAFFLTVPDGSTIRFQPAGQYRVEGTLDFNNRNGLFIDGNGARVYATYSTLADYQAGLIPPPPPNYGPNWPRSRSQILLEGGADITITNLIVHGANPAAGPSGEFDANREGQAAIYCAGVTNALIEQCTLGYTWGDGVYGGASSRYSDTVYSLGVRASRSIVVRDCAIGPVSRQGVAFVLAENVLVEGCALNGIRRSAVDFEPPSSQWFVDGAIVRNNTITRRRLSFIASLGAGRVDNILVENNTMLTSAEPNTSEQLTVTVYATADGARRRNWTVRGNFSSEPAGQLNQACMNFTNVDGVTVTGNSEPQDGDNGSSRTGIFVKTVACCDITVTGNTIPSSDGNPVYEWVNDQAGYVCP